jgi:hypothetical protein
LVLHGWQRHPEYWNPSKKRPAYAERLFISLSYDAQGKIRSISMVVVVIIPVTVGVPPLRVFIPPAVVVIPAVLAGFAQFMSRVLGLFALAAVPLDCFVQPMIGLCQSLPALFIRSRG